MRVVLSIFLVVLSLVTTIDAADLEKLQTAYADQLLQVDLDSKRRLDELTVNYKNALTRQEASF